MAKTPLLSLCPQRSRSNLPLAAYALAAALAFYAILCLPLPVRWALKFPISHDYSSSVSSPYGAFPRENDPFQFIPCTGTSQPPPLDDSDHVKTWARLFDPDPNNWSWGNPNKTALHTRGIYLCGYIDVPYDYQNSADQRIMRLAITEYQVSGLARVDVRERHSKAGHKSERTLIIEPGGPGGSGTYVTWSSAENLSQRFSLGNFDVLGWDPRGVNASQPRASCFPYDADRDRWMMLTGQHRASVASPRTQLEIADAMNNATFAACKAIIGDLPRFVGTASVVRDLDRIREALDEPELTGYFISYGTAIGQIYANMFPDRVGRMVLDGPQYTRNERLLGGSKRAALESGMAAWDDGFLGECIAAGPLRCALARPQTDQISSTPVTVEELKTRMPDLFTAIAARPMTGHTSNGGPSLVTYSALINELHSALYDPTSWPSMAQALYDLEQGNTSLITETLEGSSWEFDPSMPCVLDNMYKSSGDELTALITCADSSDACQPSVDDSDGLIWWSSLWANMTTESWITGNSIFYDVLPCRHYTHHFGTAAELYRGDLNHSLAAPILVIGESYDPATPLKNGRRLVDEMGENARLIVHHGYGHSSNDRSKCTIDIGREYILHGKVPLERETHCYADNKPYRERAKGADFMF